MRLAQPIAERRLFALIAGAAVQSDTADQAVALLQCNGKAARLAGCVILLHSSDPLLPVRFGVGVGHRRQPTRHHPVTGQRDQVNEIIITRRPHPEPSGFNHDTGRLGERSGGGFSVGGQASVHESDRLIHDRIAHAVLRTDQLHEPVRPFDIGGAVVEGPGGRGWPDQVVCGGGIFLERHQVVGRCSEALAYPADPIIDPA